jgi:diguanylate cyclase (GGDEF)-like protein
MDVDFFKSYNDQYGHLYGDTCLKQIAEASRCAATRSGDLVARFGGEEFAVILSRTRLEGALEVAESILENLNSRRLPHAGNPFGYMTISIGCATLTPQLNTDPSSLIELADKALYNAKRTGRNRVCTATPSEPQADLKISSPSQSPVATSGLCDIPS